MALAISEPHSYLGVLPSSGGPLQSKTRAREQRVGLTLRNFQLWFSLLTTGSGREEVKRREKHDVCDHALVDVLYYVLFGKSKELGGEGWWAPFMPCRPFST